MGKLFEVSANYFVFSCFVVLFCKGQPFVSVGKGERDVGLTCRCHLSNIMPDNIFNDWQRLGIT